MTPFKTFAMAAAIALGLFAVADSASARRGGGGGGYRGYHGHHHHGHHYRGYGFWGGYWGAAYWPGYWGSGWGYWGAPYIAYTQVVSQEPRVLERDLAAATPPPPAPASQDPNVQQWWYWCVSTSKYYPYVASCAEGWQRVAPQAPPAQ